MTTHKYGIGLNWVEKGGFCVKNQRFIASKQVSGQSIIHERVKCEKMKGWILWNPTLLFCREMVAETWRNDGDAVAKNKANLR